MELGMIATATEDSKPWKQDVLYLAFRAEGKMSDFHTWAIANVNLYYDGRLFYAFSWKRVRLILWEAELKFTSFWMPSFLFTQGNYKPLIQMVVDSERERMFELSLIARQIRTCAILQVVPSLVLHGK